MKAILRKIRTSPKKANLIAGIVRGKKVQEAIDILNFTPKKAAKILVEIIKSAAANAENNFNQDRDKLVISKILVTKGPIYKRHIPASRGRMAPLMKRTSHITVELSVETEIETKKDLATADKKGKQEAIVA